MATQGGDVSFKFLGDVSGLTAAVREVAIAQEAAASSAAKAAAEAKAALETQRTAIVSVTDAEKRLVAQLLGAEAATKAKAAAMGVSVGQLRQVEAATKRATDATARATAASSGLGDAVASGSTKFDKLGAAMGPLGGVLARLSPEAGAVASSIAGVTGTLNGLGASGIASTVALGPLLAIMAPLALGVGLVTLSIKSAQDAAALAQTAMEGLTRAMEATDNMTTAAADAMSDFKVMTGQTTALEAAHAKAINQLAKEHTLANNAIQESIDLRIEAAKAGEEEGLLEDVTALRAEQAALLASTQERAKAINGQKKWAEEVAKSADVLDARAKATAEAAKAQAEADAQAEKDAAEKAADLAKWVDSSQVAYDQMFAQQMKERDAKWETARMAVKGEQDKIDAIKKTTAEAEKANEATLKSALAYTQTVGASANQVLGAIGDVYTRMSDAAGAAYADSRDQVNNLRDLIDGLTTTTVDAASLSGRALVRAYKSGEVAAEDLTDAQKAAIATELEAREAAATARAKIEKKAAMSAFEASQGVAVAQALIGGSLAIIQSFAQLGPIAGAIAAVGIAAVTGVEVAVIASAKPSFHAGGMYPDEGNAKLLGGEPVINRQAAARLGLDTPGAVNDVNHGGAGGASLGGITVLRIGRMEAREIVRTDVAAGGLIVRTARAAANTNFAGRTGRRPIA